MTDDIRYSRQITLPAIGSTGQQKLSDASVLIVGMGGLGNPAALYLASSGIGQLLINDFDTIDASNLPRQVLYRNEDADKPKATTAAELLKSINPDINAIAIGERLDRDGLTELTASVNVVLDCTDNFAARWLINEVCADMQTPLVSGAAIRWEGQVAVFRHDQRGGPCYRCLYSEADENLNDCAGQGIIAPVAGTVGTMLATETIKLLLGIDSGIEGKLWAYDAISGSVQLISIPAKPDCPVCSQAARSS
jgi:molybdopterin/thiamine biosynthesis adenylyltransferase